MYYNIAKDAVLDPGTGKYQDAHSKKWYDSQKAAKAARRIENFRNTDRSEAYYRLAK